MCLKAPCPGQLVDLVYVSKVIVTGPRSRARLGFARRTTLFDAKTECPQRSAERLVERLGLLRQRRLGRGSGRKLQIQVPLRRVEPDYSTRKAYVCLR
jgi:hypothetical protein